MTVDDYATFALDQSATSAIVAAITIPTRITYAFAIHALAEMTGWTPDSTSAP